MTTVTIFVKSMKGDKYTITMPHNAKCSELPAEVAKVSDYKTESIQLIFAGKNIVNNNTTL
jgi:hypothetical protein